MDWVPSGWELAGLMCKLALYLGTASLAGGSLCLWQFSDGSRRLLQHNLLYMFCGSLIGFQAVGIGFLLQVGQLNDAGIGGMFDWDMMSLLLDTSVGDVTFLRLGAFVWGALATLFYLRRVRFATRAFPQPFYRRLVTTYGVAVVLIMGSFQRSGHASVLPFTGQLAVALHVGVAALWIGSLYPLLQLSYSPDQASLRAGMRRFGNAAIGGLLVLVLAGGLLVWQLLGSLSEFITTAYGRALLLKFGSVAVLIGIAGINKLVLVPRLEQASGAGALGRSIRYEMLAASLVLALTAYLSTVVGPAEH